MPGNGCVSSIDGSDSYDRLVDGQIEEDELVYFWQSNDGETFEEESQNLTKAEGTYCYTAGCRFIWFRVYSF